MLYVVLYDGIKIKVFNVPSAVGKRPQAVYLY